MQTLEYLKVFLSTNPGFAVASLCIVAVIWLYRALRAETAAHLATVKQFAADITPVLIQTKDVADLLLFELNRRQPRTDNDT